MTAFEKGRRYRVLKRGARLTGWRSVAPSAFQGTGQKLEPGDVVTFTGYSSFGSDGVDEAQFQTEGGFRGAFNPNSWGAVPRGYLEEV